MKWLCLLLLFSFNFYIFEVSARIGSLTLEGTEILIDLDEMPICDGHKKPCSYLVSLFETVMLYGAESDITPKESTSLFANMITSIKASDIPEEEQSSLIKRICKFQYKPPACLHEDK